MVLVLMSTNENIKTSKFFKHSQQIRFHSWIPVTFCLQCNLFSMFEKLDCLDVFICAVIKTMTRIDYSALLHVFLIQKHIRKKKKLS